MERLYAIGAGLVVLVHFSFVLFVAAGRRIRRQSVLPPQAQVVIGTLIVAANLGLYIFVYIRRRRLRAGGKP